MRGSRSLAGLALIILLVACSKDDGAARADRDAARRALQVSQAPGGRTMGMGLPLNRPPYAPVPQDSFVTAAVGSKGASGGSIEFSTNLPPAVVAQYYEMAAEQAGLQPQPRNAESGILAWKASSGSTALSVEILPLESVGSTVRLRY